jgi:hypothetical protein
MTDDATRIDRALAELAAAQFGVLSPRQAAALGLTSSGLNVRLARGTLHRLECGALAVGHTALSADALLLAPVLMAGRGARLCDRSAAARLDLRRWSGRVEIAIPTVYDVGVPGALVRRLGTLTDADLVLVGGIPCTSPARTIVDTAARLDRVGIASVLRRADFHGLLDVRAIQDVLDRVARPRGVRNLRAELAIYTPGPPITEGLAERWERFARRHGLPPHEVEQWILLADGRGRRADVLYRAERVVVELDGRAAHERLAAVAEDRERDRELAGVGYLTFRVGGVDLTPKTARELTATLAHRRRWRGDARISDISPPSTHLGGLS